MSDYLLMHFVVVAFTIVSLSLAASFLVNAWADYRLAKFEIDELEKYLNDETDDTPS